MQINLPAKSPPEILMDLAQKFAAGELRSLYLCAVDRNGKAGNMMFVEGPAHARAIGEEAVQLCDRIDAMLSPKLPGVA